MKKFRVYASQTVYHYKDIEAESAEQAEEISWEIDNSSWVEFDYGDWQQEEGTKEITA